MEHNSTHWDKFTLAFVMVGIFTALFPIIARASSVVFPNELFIPNLLLFVPTTIPVFVGVSGCIIIAFLRPKSLYLKILPFFAVVWFLGIGFEINAFFKDAKQEQNLTVVSWNMGQNYGHSIDPFIYKTDPDFVLLQESSQVDLKNLSASNGWERSSVGEFSLFSKRPVQVVQSILDPTVSENAKPIAVRYVCEDTNGRQFAIYNVHLPTLREIWKESRFALPNAVLHFNQKKIRDVLKTVNEEWEHHLQCSESLISHIVSEPLPFIVGGDFNAPPGSNVHRKLKRVATDSFDAKGKGFGFTFPGKSRWKFSLTDSIHRIDYLYSSSLFSPKLAYVEKKNQCPTSGHSLIFYI